MTAETPAVVHSFRVGRRTCTLTVAAPKSGRLVHAVAEWEPSPPSRLSRRELRQYRAGRHAALAELMAERQREAAAERMRRTRERRRRGAHVVSLTVEAEVVDALEDATGRDLETSADVAGAVTAVLTAWAAGGDDVARNAGESDDPLGSDT